MKDPAASITSEQIDQLLDYLPYFTRFRTEDVKWFTSSNADVATFPHPLYPDPVIEFFRLAGQPHWSDYDYSPKEQISCLQDRDYIDQANLAQIKSLLTYCVRGERFSDGFWLSTIKEGVILTILERLAKIRKSLT